MPVQQQRAAAAGAAPGCDHARPLISHDLYYEPAIREPVGDKHRQLALTSAARNERRVDGVDRDQLRSQLGQLGHLGHLSPLSAARVCVRSPGGTGG